jgi:hypothetical protein
MQAGGQLGRCTGLLRALCISQLCAVEQTAAHLRQLGFGRVALLVIRLQAFRQTFYIYTLGRKVRFHREPLRLKSAQLAWPGCSTFAALPFLMLSLRLC